MYVLANEQIEVQTFQAKILSKFLQTTLNNQNNIQNDKGNILSKRIQILTNSVANIESLIDSKQNSSKADIDLVFFLSSLYFHSSPQNFNSVFGDLASRILTKCLLSADRSSRLKGVSLLQKSDNPFLFLSLNSLKGNIFKIKRIIRQESELDLESIMFCRNQPDQGSICRLSCLEIIENVLFNIFFRNIML